MNTLYIRSYSTGLFDSQIVNIMVWQEKNTCHYRSWLCSLTHTFAIVKATRQIIKRIIAMVLIWHAYTVCNSQPACILVCNIQWDKEYLEGTNSTINSITLFTAWQHCHTSPFFKIFSVTGMWYTVCFCYHTHASAAIFVFTHSQNCVDIKHSFIIIGSNAFPNSYL